jgi:hypothetical protein
MKKKSLTALIAVIILILVISASCGTTSQPTPTATKPAATTSSAPAAAPTTQIVMKDKAYKVINPTGEFIPVETKPLAARLDTMDGKTIWMCQTEADPVIMPALWDRLQKEFTKTTWKKTVTSATTPLRLTADEQKTAQAMISGVAW